MKRSIRRQLRALRRTMLPQPEPDLSHLTSTEQVGWAAERYGLDEVIRQANDPDRPPSLPEEDDALDARDALILARRAAADANERLEHWPKSVAAQQAVHETREALETAEKEYEKALRAAEEAKSRPPPPTPVEEEKPSDAAEAPPEAAAIEQPSAPATPEPEPPPPPQPKQWWEERARWTPRPSWQDEDARRGRPEYECIHEYDPIARFLEEREEDDDPFE